MSMFLDTAKIKVKAGNGGDGMVAFVAKNMSLMADLGVVMGSWWQCHLCSRRRLAYLDGLPL